MKVLSSVSFIFSAYICQIERPMHALSYLAILTPITSAFIMSTQHLQPPDATSTATHRVYPTPPTTRCHKHRHPSRLPNTSNHQMSQAPSPVVSTQHLQPPDVTSTVTRHVYPTPPTTRCHKHRHPSHTAHFSSWCHLSSLFQPTPALVHMASSYLPSACHI